MGSAGPGSISAIRPTFPGSASLLIGVGVFRIVVAGDTGPAPTQAVIEATQQTTESVGILILLRAFASGAVALTGTEAIATGVPAFSRPNSRNAARTPPLAMAVILGVLFVGIAFLATNFHILPIYEPKQTVISQIARHVYGDTIGFYLFQAFTALLLFLAANTSYNAFPRLAAVLAADGYFPRPFAFRGDRLDISPILLSGSSRDWSSSWAGDRPCPHPALRRGRVPASPSPRRAWFGTGWRRGSRVGATGHDQRGGRRPTA